MSTGYLRRPPDKKKPRPSVQTARLPKGSTGERADPEDSTKRSKRYIVVAIKQRGARVVIGRCTSFEEAEVQAAKHRKFIGVNDTRIVVEHIEVQR